MKNLLQDLQKLPKDKTERYLKLPEDMRDRAIVERQRREKANKKRKSWIGYPLGKDASSSTFILLCQAIILIVR